MAKLPSKVFDICITDPPYNVGINYNVHNDNMADYEDWCKEWFSECERITKHIILISCGISNLGSWHNIKKPDWILAWHKPGAMGRCTVGFNNWEPILLYGKVRKQTVDVIRAPIITDKNIGFHPCPKPLAWAAQQLSQFAQDGDVLFDPFIGSGTTAIAAHDGGFDFVGCEIDKDYFDAAKKRLNIHQSQGRLF